MTPELQSVGDEAFVHEQSPELHHYTNAAGLKGILDSQCLWACHYASMNDGLEWIHAREVLERELPALMKEKIRVMGRGDKEFRHNVQQAGGLRKSSPKVTIEWIDMLYKATEASAYLKQIPFATPYILSFCSHAGDKKYEQENGLLSQWRGYGGKSSYAIVFDSKKLTDLIKLELNTHEALQLFFFDVKYDRSHEEIVEFFSGSIRQLTEAFERVITHKPQTQDDMKAFLSLSTRIKHRGFFEEREYRIVTFPFHKSYLEFVATMKNTDQMDTTSRQESREGDGPRHIKLFQGLGQELPINMIIVGPSNNQDADVAFAKRVVGNRKIKVRASETPLINRRANS